MSGLSFQAPALQLLWQGVTSDPMDFQSWTALLSQVESVGSVEDAHRAYDGFLRQFPLCFGYWKKYANLARRHSSRISPGTATEVTTTAKGAEEGGSGGRARQVLERAVSAAPFCLEIWEALVRDVMAGIGGEGSGVTVEDARRVYERALEAVGDNPAAGGLWRRCVEFEESQEGQEHRTARLYERAFGYRLKDLEVLWADFKSFADRTPWTQLVPPVAVAAVGASGVPGDDDGKADASIQAEARAGTAASVAAALEGRTDAEKKERFVKILEQKRKVSLRGRERRESFERRITRPHFHVKPLDDAQLSAWSQYLDFEQAQAASASAATTASAAKGETAATTTATAATASAAGTTSTPTTAAASSGTSTPIGLATSSPLTWGRKRQRVEAGAANKEARDGAGHRAVQRLFERCLVSCASYWWIWERYALWKESIWGVGSALEVADRACSPFLQWRPEALFFRAELLERTGRMEDARAVYHRVLSEVSLGLVEAACKLACFERRTGDRKAADAAYRLLLPPPIGGGGGGAGTGGEGKRPPRWEETTETTRPYLYMQLARFQQRVLGDPTASRTTFRAAVADIPGSRELWLAFLEFEAAQPQALHAGRVEAAFRMAVEGEGEDVGVGDTSEDARHLTVEDRADLWEWFEEFVEDMTMDIAKVMRVRAEHRAWTQAHGTGAHEAAAAIAAAASPTHPTDGKCTENGNGDVNVNRNNSRPMEDGRGPAATTATTNTATIAAVRAIAPTPGVFGGGLGSGHGGNAGGVAGGIAVSAAGSFMATEQQTMNQWSAYFQQQALHQHLMVASTGGIVQQAYPVVSAAATAAPRPQFWPTAANYQHAQNFVGPQASAGLQPPQTSAGLQQQQQQQLQQQQQQLAFQLQQQQLHHQVYGTGYKPPPPPQQGQGWRG